VLSSHLVGDLERVCDYLIVLVGSRVRVGRPERPRTPTLALMHAPSKAELNAMIEEATIDAHDEEEQLMGFANLLEENVAVPFDTTVLGVKVTVTSIGQGSRRMVAHCVRGKHRQAISLLDLPLPEPPPQGAEWIAAYRHWAR
jgi:hypothetical protein